MENPLKSVSKWLYHLGDVNADRAKEIGDSNADMVVIDYFTYGSEGPRPYTSDELNTMRGLNDKLILSYISIGEAEDYRPYWQSSWDHKPPNFLSASNPEWPDNYKVKYWEKGWQDIVLKYVDDVVKAGFNGLYMDIIDGFQYWEEVAPRTKVDYQQEMADFVAAIRDRAEKTLAQIGDKREFVLIGQNGEELITNEKYLAAIDGVAKEDLRFYYGNEHESNFKPVPSGWFEGSTPYLEMAEANGVEVFVVEYLTKVRQTQYADILKAEVDYLNANGIPLYLAEDRDLGVIYEQPAGLAGPEMPVDAMKSAPVSGADRPIDSGGADRSEDGCNSGPIDGRVGDDKLFWGSGSATADGSVDSDPVSSGAARLLVDVPLRYTTAGSGAEGALWDADGGSTDPVDGAVQQMATDASLFY